MRGGAAVQAALMELPWPEEVLDHPSCQTWQMDGQVIFRGPRLSIGLSHGAVIKKLPNPSTGRADYFGERRLPPSPRAQGCGCMYCIYSLWQGEHRCVCASIAAGDIAVICIVAEIHDATPV